MVIGLSECYLRAGAGEKPVEGKVAEIMFRRHTTGLEGKNSNPVVYFHNVSQALWRCRYLHVERSEKPPFVIGTLDQTFSVSYLQPGCFVQVDCKFQYKLKTKRVLNYG